MKTFHLDPDWLDPVVTVRNDGTLDIQLTEPYDDDPVTWGAVANRDRTRWIVAEALDRLTPSEHRRPSVILAERREVMDHRDPDMAASSADSLIDFLEAELAAAITAALYPEEVRT